MSRGHAFTAYKPIFCLLVAGVALLVLGRALAPKENVR